MALLDTLKHVAKYPGMYLPAIEFDIAVGFLQGFDLASSGGLLVGFREWLVPRVGFGNNLAWSELALFLIFPDVESPRRSLGEEGNL